MYIEKKGDLNFCLNNKSYSDVIGNEVVYYNRGPMHSKINYLFPASDGDRCYQLFSHRSLNLHEGLYGLSAPDWAYCDID